MQAAKYSPAKLLAALRDPGKLRRGILSRLSEGGGLSSIHPGSYISKVPARYGVNHDKYIERGGICGEELIRNFLADNDGNKGDLPRYYFFSLIMDQIVKENLRGDIAELGVYRGNTAFLLAELARKMAATVYLLDTFEGFAPSDLSGIDADKKMEFADTSVEAVRAKVGSANVKFIKGYFPDSASQMPDDARFSLVHIDCDLYAPFRAGLNYFYPRLVPGGFLVMHDYSSLYWDGAEKAVDEFLADKPERIIPVPDSCGTVAIRKV